jgi:hypothetical protein
MENESRYNVTIWKRIIVLAVLIVIAYLTYL